MSDVDDLVTWLRAIWDEDEAWARGASRPYEYAAEGATAPTDGVHWRWVVGDHWETVAPNPATDEFVAEPGYNCWLATVEEWPSATGRDRMMPRTYANSIVEMDSAAAGHVARHDPARVLREVEAKRRILDLHDYDVDGNSKCSVCLEFESSAGAEMEPFPCPTIRLLAAPYADRPGYRDEAWRP